MQRVKIRLAYLRIIEAKQSRKNGTPPVLHVHGRTNYISGRHNESRVSTSVQKMRICVLSLLRVSRYTDYTIVYHIVRLKSVFSRVSSYAYTRECMRVHGLYKHVW